MEIAKAATSSTESTATLIDDVAVSQSKESKTLNKYIRISSEKCMTIYSSMVSGLPMMMVWDNLLLGLPYGNLVSMR